MHQSPPREPPGLLASALLASVALALSTVAVAALYLPHDGDDAGPRAVARAR